MFAGMACIHFGAGRIGCADQSDDSRELHRLSQRRAKEGRVDLIAMLAHFETPGKSKGWVQVESMIVNRKMPPDEEKPLAAEQVAAFEDWFTEQFVTPGGTQHVGPSHPRRLTREELQNTLEDILQLDIRETVTNSRLHVIPDTVIEKFFAAGVIGESGFSNDAVTLSKESIDIQTYLRCFAMVLSQLDSNQEGRRHVFGQEEVPDELSPVEARKAN